MKIVLYLHMHQPWRLARFRYLDLGSGRPYFDVERNLRIFREIAQRSYRPTLEQLGRMLESDPGFRVNFSITGTFVEQAQEVAPDVLETVRRLCRTGRVAILAETYPHSLAFLLPPPELEEEVAEHARLVREVFGVRPRALRMTELAYSDELARFAQAEGYPGILAEGWDPVLQGRSPNQVFRAYGSPGVKVLPRNYRLSDDVGFRFSARGWNEYPLTADKYVRWIASSPGEVLGLFMDFETFGEHHPASSGIFQFLEALPREVRHHSHLSWATVEEAFELPAHEVFSSPNIITWADQRRDLGAWLGNDLQRSAFEAAKKVGTLARLLGDPRTMATWRRLVTSDHFYYMYLGEEGDDLSVHQHFSSYTSPFDAYANYMNALTDLRNEVARRLSVPPSEQRLPAGVQTSSTR